ncbi:MAG TPA: hypothetical protein EYP49_14615 [Anaerolineae bacterium]|nr:hypothetical protein [Anaerolineae bacterium]
MDESKLSTTLKIMGMIFALTLLVRLIAALPIQRPGYMDAYYYYDGAEALYRGLGFSEEFIWNYLDDPQGIPHPSHLYWPPLSSILAYLSFLVFGPSHRAAQLPFILLSATLPLITYYVSLHFVSGSGDLSESRGGDFLRGSRPIALAVLWRITPNAVGLLPLSERTHVKVGGVIWQRIPRFARRGSVTCPLWLI